MTNLKQYKMFIGGEWVDSETKKTFKSLNPENNEAWVEVLNIMITMRVLQIK